MITQGIADHVGSLEVSKLADLYLSPQPVRTRPMFCGFGGAIAATSLTFVSQAALEEGVPDQIDLQKNVVAISNTRNLSKSDMKLNDALPKVEVDSETYEVRADGELLTYEPATVLPMAQRYFLF